MTRTVILDNEAVQVLRDPAQAKHRQVVSLVQVVASRKSCAVAIDVVVPTAVRVEAGWDRTASAWAFPNQLRIADISLDAASASTAAAIRERTRVSVADAHVGAVIQSTPASQITVVTSDPEDMRLVAGDRNVTVVSI
jgi:predicted nucleic acid-binding protein